MKNTNDEYLIPLPVCEPPSLLRITEDKIDKFIFYKDQLLYQVAKIDMTQQRYVAVQLFLSHAITQATIASAFGLRRETINDWVKKFRKDGVSGLESHRKQNTKLTPEMMDVIAELKAKKVKRVEIARRLKIHVTSVDNACKEMKKASLPPELPSFSNQEKYLPKDSEINIHLSKETLDKTDIENDCLFEDTAAEYIITSDDNASPSCQQINPLDRSVDRMLASSGLLNDAEPIFAEHEHVENAGSLLAIAMLSEDCFLSSVKQTYRSFGASFFGLRNTFVCFFLMAVLRIKNINSIERKNGLVLGRLMGLDRSPCSKTLRRKLSYLTSRNQALNTMNIIAQKRIEESTEASLDNSNVTLYLDGHIHKYSGKEKFSKTFSTSKNRVVKGASDYYLNLPDSTPLLFIPTDFNQSMFEMMPKIIIQAKKICKKTKLTIVFDRGGSSPRIYELIMNLGCDFIAYHKNPKAIDLDLFEVAGTEINSKKYSRKPYDHEIELEVRERHGAIYKKTGRKVKIREIVVLRDDDKQTSVLTSRRDLQTEAVPTIIFQRWTQENYFKYGLEHYNIDALCTYKTEAVDADIDRPNPEYTNATKQIAAIRKKISSLMRLPNEKLIEKEFKLQDAQLSTLYKPEQQKELLELSSTLQKEKEFRDSIERRIKVEDYRKFNDEARLVSNLVKMSAYNVEGKLAKVFKEVSNYKNGNERGIIEHFTHTTGALSVTTKALKICLEAQSTPAKTRELDALCQEVNKLKAVYPGSNLIMEFSVQGVRI